VTSENLGAQNAVAAGGRYDRLVREFGGPEVPAVGFAIGMERLVDLVKQSVQVDNAGPALYIASVGEAAHNEGLLIAETLRARGIWVESGDPEASLKSQMRRADRLSAAYVFIIGEDELAAGMASWKRMSDGLRERSVCRNTGFLSRDAQQGGYVENNDCGTINIG